MDDSEDLDEPSGAEAEAQREETIMPWVWGALGLALIAAIIAAAIMLAPSIPPSRP